MGLPTNLDILGLAYKRNSYFHFHFLVYIGTCFFLPVFGGWLADSLAGKFSVIFYSVIIFLFGTLLLPLGSISENDRHIDWAKTSLTANKTFKRAIFLFGLALVALGTGGMKANMAPLGAEQISENRTRKFFYWFGWFFNIGAILANTFVVYVQQNVSYFYGYLISTCSIVIALIIFLAGKPSYLIRPPVGSVLTRTLKIVTQAVKRPQASVHVHHWLGRAKQCFGGSYDSHEVEDVKKVCRLFPIFATFILFCTVCGQVSVCMGPSLCRLALLSYSRP